MVNSLFKSAIREIRQSLGRYIAIMAIVGLGVGFFAGLRMSQPNMNATGVEYLKTHNMHDFRLLSTLGFTSEDVSAFEGVDGISNVHGAVYREFLWQSSPEEETILIAHSLTKDINEPSLVAGRMPTESNECLADADRFTVEDIGKKIEISSKNDADTKDLFVHDTYTIVGIGKSPYYLNYERGTSTIGAGDIAGFVYIPESGFAFDAYYELFLTLDGQRDAYSPEYDTQIERVKPALEDMLSTRAQIRYDTIYQDASTEIADAEKELNEGWGRYYREKGDAEQQLSDAYDELTIAQDKLNQGQIDYEKGKVEYEKNLKTYEDALAQLKIGEASVAEQRANFETEKAAVVQQLNEAKKTMDEAQAKYDEQQALYVAGLQNLEQSKIQASTLEQKIETSRISLVELKKSIDALKAQLDAMDQADPNYAVLNEQYQKAVQTYEKDFAQQEQDIEKLTSINNEIATLESALSTQESVLNQMLAELDAQWTVYNAQVDRVNAQLTEGDKQLSAAEAELQNTRNALTAAKQQLDQAHTKLENTPAALEQAGLALEQGWQEYSNSKNVANKEFKTAYQELRDGEEELADAKQQLSELEKPTTFLLTRDENTGYVCFENDTSIVKSISVVFPVFFFLVAALVCMTTMTRMIDEQRTQIGVLKAMGYSNGQIMSKYMLYSGSAALIGCFVGYALGSFLMPKIIWEIYGMMYGFAQLKLTFDPMLALISFISALLCSVGATYIACKKELSKPAAQLIRPKAPKAGKRVFLEYITPLWSRLSFLHKVSIRNVLRYRSRLVMMVLGIGGCTALLVTGFGICDSIMRVVDDQYTNITLYDFEVSLQDELQPDQSDDFLSELGYASDDGLLVYSGSIDIVTDSSTKSVNLVVPADATTEGFVDFHRGTEHIDFPKVNEAVIDAGLAKELNLSVGDKLQLRDTKLGTISVTISGIYDNYFFNCVYISPETYAAQLNALPQYKTMFLHANDVNNVYEESLDVLDDELVTTVMVVESMQNRATEMLSRLDYVTIIVVVCAAALAFIVLYNLTNINITERVREIATIKVLGFEQNEVSSYVFREINFLSMLGSVFGLLMGKALHLFVMAQVQVDGMYFPPHVEAKSYLISMVLTIVFSLVITFFMRPKVNRIDMAESLKSIE